MFFPCMQLRKYQVVRFLYRCSEVMNFLPYLFSISSIYYVDIKMNFTNLTALITFILFIVFNYRKQINIYINCGIFDKHKHTLN